MNYVPGKFLSKNDTKHNNQRICISPTRFRVKISSFSFFSFQQQCSNTEVKKLTKYQ